MQTVTVTVTVEVPEVSDVRKFSDVTRKDVSSAYFSNSKGKVVLVKDMHICHVYNAFYKAMREMPMEEVMAEMAYREMAYRLATEPML